MPYRDFDQEEEGMFPQRELIKPMITGLRTQQLTHHFSHIGHVTGTFLGLFAIYRRNRRRHAGWCDFGDS